MAGKKRAKASESVIKNARSASAKSGKVVGTTRARKVSGSSVSSRATAKSAAAPTMRARSKAGADAPLVAPVSKQRPVRRIPRLVPLEAPQPVRLRELEDLVSGAASVTVEEGNHRVVLSGSTLGMLKQVVSALKDGPTTLLVGAEDDAELTSQEAADLLNVSRPFVVKLAKEGRLPHHTVGNRHRFLLADVLAYDQQARSDRDAALTALAPEGGYSAEDF